MNFHNGLARVDRNVSAFDVFAAFFMRLSVRKFACCRPVNEWGCLKVMSQLKISDFLLKLKKSAFSVKSD